MIKKFNKAWIGVIVWMVVIFLFSAQGGEASSALSQSITEFVVGKLQAVHLLPAGSLHNMTFMGHIEAWLRQLAHFGLFMILGMFIANAFRVGRSFGWKLWVFSLLFCVGYALVDEIMQRFSPGRAFQLIDILTDACGGFFGILLYIGLVKLYYKIRDGGKDAFNDIGVKKEPKQHIPHYNAKHVYCDIPVHLVFVTKDKHPILVDQIAQLLRNCIRSVCAEFGITIKKGYISDDHVHLILNLIPDIPLDTIVHRIQGKSNRIILKEKRLIDPKVIKRNMWHSGYFVASSSDVDEHIIQSYIDSPEIDMPDSVDVISISSKAESLVS